MLESTVQGDFTFRHADRGIKISARHLRPVDQWFPGTQVIGALPFDSEGSTPELLYVTDCPLTIETLPVVGENSHDGVKPLSVDAGTRQTYTGAVTAALSELSAPGGLNKVVLGRPVRATVAEAPHWESLLRRLSQRNPSAWVFSIPLGADHAFLGASPELLIRRRGDLITSHPLAGSVPHSDDPVEDRRRAEQLASSPKDHREHAYVVDMIAETLAPLCAELSVPKAPELLSTDTMWHLGTKITGRLSATGPGTDALSLARLLHPTPAVAGVPTAAAKDRIRHLESGDRRYFAGTAGWCDGDGDGDWVVSIRSAEVAGDRITAWAGAGIVDGSDPDAEYVETGAKLGTVLEGLGIHRAKEYISGY